MGNAECEWGMGMRKAEWGKRTVSPWRRPFECGMRNAECGVGNGECRNAGGQNSGGPLPLNLLGSPFRTPHSPFCIGCNPHAWINFEILVATPEVIANNPRSV